MKLSALGAACASFAVAQAEMAGMILDNGTMAASNAVAAIGAMAASGNVRYSQMVEITSEPDALGRVPVMAGKLLLVPRISGSGFLQFMDPADGSITTTALAIPNYTTNSMFSCAVTLPNGIVQMVPFTNPAFVHYDPWAHTIAAGPVHGRTSTNTVPAFAGACIGKDDLAWYTPGHPADKAMCSYNYVTGAFAVSAIALPYNADWQATNNGSSVIPLPDGDLLVLTARAVALGAPWRIRPSTGTVTNATITSSTNASIMAGGVLSADGKHVVLVEGIGSKVRCYRLADNTLLDAVSFTALPANPWSGITMLPDGKLGFIGNGFTGFGIFDPTNFKMVLGTVAATGVLTATGNFADGETVTVAGLTYTFKAALGATARQVLIGATTADSLANLAAAITGSVGAGTTYVAAATSADIGSATVAGAALTVSAATLGTAGNSVAIAETAANASWGSATLAGGVNIGSTSGVPGVASGSASNTNGGRSIAGGKVAVLPGTNLTAFITWQPFATGAVAEGVRKSRYYDRK